MGLLDGKAGVITGGGRGIAGATASLLAAEGASVVIGDLGASLQGEGEALVAEEKATEIKAAGGQAVGLKVNVSNPDDCDALVQACLDTYGKVDFAITAAGILRDRVLINMTDEEYDAVINVHQKGTFYTARAAARAMRQQRFGAIITVTSISQQGNPGQSNYSGSKGAIASMTYCWSQELSRYGVNVNSVLPSAYTRMISSIPGMGEFDPAAVPPGSSMGTPEQVAPLFVYLASDEAKWMTGQVIALGGDRLALWQTPREKIIVTNRGGHTVEDLRREMPAIFQGQLEPVGMGATLYKAVDYEAAQQKK